MRIARILAFAGALFISHLAVASHYRLELTDHAAPGVPSQFRVGGLCGTVEIFEFPAEGCNYDGSLLELSVLSALDEKLSLQATGIEVREQAEPFDRYVTFRDAGSSGPLPDDVLRIRWSPVTHTLFVDLVSGSLVAGYLANDLIQSMEVGRFVASPAETIYLDEATWFGSWDGSLHPVRLSVIPNSVVAEPSVIALVGIALGLWGALRRHRRVRGGPLSSRAPVSLSPVLA